LKRSLHVVDDTGEPPVHPPRAVAIGDRLVSVVDTGDGRSGLRFVDLLVDAGGAQVKLAHDANIDLRVVIRGTVRSPAARLRAEALEGPADVLLGSTRPAFARLFASACAHWVNS
jgi:hypothetical protein